MTTSFVIDPLSSQHDRHAFFCGVAALDRYIRQQASQDIKRRTAACYVASETNSNRIAGYYTLSAGDMALTEVPEPMALKLPRYPFIPVARIGRLAIDTGFQGQRLGAALLWDAAEKAARAEMGVFALVVDAKDERSANFYRHHGFVAFYSDPLRLFLPLATVRKCT